MTKSSASGRRGKVDDGKPPKPYDDFPLFPHASGRWAKKIRGRLHYFGKWGDRKNGKLTRLEGDGWQPALDLYQDERDDLHAGRTPRTNRDGLTLRDLCNRFLTSKQRLLDSEDISPRTFADYKRTTDRLVDVFGKKRLVEDLAAEDFESLRAKIAKTWGPVAIGNEVTRIRVVFKYAFEAGLIDKPVRFGPTFKKPSRRVLRRTRNENGPRMFEATDVRRMLAAAPVQLKAMILLGINCGFGNHDCGTLPLSAVDLESGWIDYPRPKTEIQRRCSLWPETVQALREAISDRPAPKDEADDRLVFITKYGRPWAKDTADNPISKETVKLLKSIDKKAEAKAKEEDVDPPAKLYRKRRTFYALRHTFETIGGESRDQVAVNHIMGHVDESMAAVYREQISDERLQAVVDHVHQWLFSETE